MNFLKWLFSFFLDKKPHEKIDETPVKTKSTENTK